MSLFLPTPLMPSFHLLPFSFSLCLSFSFTPFPSFFISLSKLNSNLYVSLHPYFIAAFLPYSFNKPLCTMSLPMLVFTFFLLVFRLKTPCFFFSISCLLLLDLNHYNAASIFVCSSLQELCRHAYGPEEIGTVLEICDKIKSVLPFCLILSRS